MEHQVGVLIMEVDTEHYFATAQMTGSMSIAFSSQIFVYKLL